MVLHTISIPKTNLKSEEKRRTFFYFFIASENNILLFCFISF